MAMVAQESKLSYSIVECGLQSFDRARAFKELRAGLKLYKPDATLIYAYACEELSPQDMLKLTSIYRDPDEEKKKRLDYVLVYRFIRTYPNGMQEYMYWIECPMKFSPKSLNTFMLYKKKGKLKEFFADYMNSTIKVKPDIFNKYIEQVAKLASRPKMIDKTTKEKIDNPKYWKRTENIGKVLDAISEMSLMYREKE